MQHKILIAEDDTDISRLLSRILEAQGYQALQAFSGTEALSLIEREEPDLLLLDLMLPGLSGEELLRKLREERRYSFPVLILSAKSALGDKVALLKSGADDYITKPFDLREVIARVRTILRRFDKIRETAEDAPLVCGHLTVREREHSIYKDDDLLTLTPKEYELLVCFLKHPRQVFTRTALLDQIWGYDFAGDTRTVDIHVQRIRKKAELEGMLVTVFGVGYKYVPQ